MCRADAPKGSWDLWIIPCKHRGTDATRKKHLGYISDKGEIESQWEYLDQTSQCLKFNFHSVTKVLDTRAAQNGGKHSSAPISSEISTEKCSLPSLGRFHLRLRRYKMDQQISSLIPSSFVWSVHATIHLPFQSPRKKVSDNSFLESAQILPHQSCLPWSTQMTVPYVWIMHGQVECLKLLGAAWQ